MPEDLYKAALDTLFRHALKGTVDIRPRKSQSGELEIVVKSSKGDVSSIKDLVTHGTPTQLIQRLADKRG